MQLFISNYSLKVDKKGRVSVPAAFRHVLSKGSSNEQMQLVAYNSFTNKCIEACSQGRLEQLYEAIDQLDPFAPERDAFANTILGQASVLSIDNDGRVILPASLLEFAGIDNEVVFVGKGKTFEIWHPQMYQNYAAKARELALAKRAALTLGQTVYNSKG
ncbi:MAG: division/cell wall cluster transcriptional repressor MraZ [Pseudomonadota bacterium]